MEFLREVLFGPGGSYLDGVLEGLAFLLAAPGELLLRTFSGTADDETYVTRIRDYALPLGILVWLLGLFAARQWWLARRNPEQAQARAESVTRVVRDGYGAIERSVAPPLQVLSRAWSWPAVWGAVWRAQVVHLVLYAVLPVLWIVAQAALFLALFPFVGNAVQRVANSLGHFDQPVCWVFVSNCRSPFSTFRNLTEEEVTLCRNGACPPENERLVDPDRWVWKGAWAIVTIAWILLWRRRLRLRGRPPPSAV